MVLIFSVALFFAAIAFFFFTFSAEEHTLSNQLKKNGAALSEAEEFILEKDPTPERMLGKRGDSVIKIKITKGHTPESGRAYLKERAALLKSVFEPQLPPYPEFLTKEAGCADTYKPVEKQAAYGPYFLLYAGERFGYGVCADDLIQYKASFGIFYCEKSGNAFEIEYFAPKETDENIFTQLNDSFRCES